MVAPRRIALPAGEQVSDPDSEEQLELLGSFEAIDERRAARLGELPVYFGGPIAGRRREEIASPDHLPFTVEVVDESVLRRLDATLVQHSEPLFDKFTDHYRVEPTKEAYDLYFTRRKVSQDPRQTRLREEAEAARAARRLTPEGRQADTRAAQRQFYHKKDLLQRSISDDLDTANLRRWSLKVVRYQLSHGITELDASATTVVCDALQDFADCLGQYPQIQREVGDESLSFKIRHIGEQAGNKTELLHQNQQLLRLVQREQARRVGFWSERLNFALSYLGDRLALSSEEKAKQKANAQELERLFSLVEFETTSE